MTRKQADEKTERLKNGKTSKMFSPSGFFVFRFLGFFVLSFFSVLVFWCSVACANIVVRATIINPSATQEREVPFKSYLPKEVKPEDIVDMGDLEIAYDPKESAYYVYKNYILAPRESVIVEIEMEDVWNIPGEEIDSIRSETEKVAQILEKTDYRARADYLKNSILEKLDRIERTQTVVNPSPGGYISDYRENLKSLEAVKADLQAAKTLMAEAQSIAPMLTWKLILAVVSFLGLLGIVFFIIWQKQIKSLAELTEDYNIPEESIQPSSAAPEEGEKRQAEEEKKSDVSDIERRLREEKK